MKISPSFSPQIQNRAPWMHPFSAMYMIGFDLIASSKNIFARIFFFATPLLVLGFFILALFVVWRTQRNFSQNKYRLNLLKKITLKAFLIIFLIVILPVFCLVFGSYFLCAAGPCFHFLSSVYKNLVNHAASLGYLNSSSIALIHLRVFTATLITITWLQHRFAKNSIFISFAKGTAAGILCGLPSPIWGTATGTFLLLKSGLDFLNIKYAKYAQ